MAGGIDISVGIRGNKEVEAALKLMKRSMSERAALRKMARAARGVVIDGIRAAQFSKEGSPRNTPKKVHYSYRKGKRVAKFLPGHLEKSIRDVSTVKKQYGKSTSLYIGPVFTGKASAGGTFSGQGVSVDAYYTHMMLGRAVIYEKSVIERGFGSVKGIAGGLVVKAAEKEIRKNARKAGFNVR